MYRNCIKRILDIVLSFLGIVVLAIPMLIVAVIIKIDSPGPVFFRQKRIGIHKKTFNIIKFRSMSVKAPHDMPTHQLKNPDAYLSKWQRFMRSSSIDELPQLFCIFTGKMSIIGPRPALWNQDDLVAERDKHKDGKGNTVNDLRPGLTGWAQIHGRDTVEIPDKARYDGMYLERVTFAMDLKCFFGTIGVVLKRDGVVEGGTGELGKVKDVAE